MKSNRLSRLRASIAGLTFAVAAIAGAVVPALDAAAATAVTSVTATWNGTNRTVEVAWTGTGIPGDTYSVEMGSGAGMSFATQDELGATNTGISSNSAIVKTAGPTAGITLDDGDTWYFYVTTTSSDSSTATSSDTPQVTIGQTTGSSANASAPVNLTATTGGSGAQAYGYAQWDAPQTSGTTAISGWQVTVANADGSNPIVESSKTTDVSLGAMLTYSFVNGQTYKVTVAAINGADGVSPNSAETTFTYTGATQSGGSQTTDNAPKAPDTGYTLGLANPIAVLGIGALAAAILFIAGRKLVRR